MNIEALLLIIFVSAAAVSAFVVGARVRERGEQMRRAKETLESARASLDARESKHQRAADYEQYLPKNWPAWQFYFGSRL